MGTNGSFYQLGLSYGTAETGLGNVPASATPTPAPSSFYQAGAAYSKLSNTDALTASLATTLAATQASQAAAALSASQAAASLAAMSPSGATPLMDGTAVPGVSTLFSRGDHVHPTDTSRAPLAAPAFSGVPTAPTASANNNTTQIATTAYVDAADALKAPLASPTLTGTPAAPTASAGTNTTQLATTAFVLANAPSVGKNKLINGGFTINQRAWVSAATLAVGLYGHDRWKAGASGGDYSFAQLASPTTITIAASKSLVQVVEDKNVDLAGSYTLSWTGTATARLTVNSATPSGSFAASPITVAGQTAGTTMCVEFGAGTLGTAQLEAGTKATAFDFRPYPIELFLCQRYCFVIFPGAAAAAVLPGGCGSTTASYFPIVFPSRMFSTPTMTVSAASDWNSNPFYTGASQQNATAFIFGATSPIGSRCQLTHAANAAGSGAFSELNSTTTAAKITASSEL